MQTCKRCLMDSTVPEIKFDDNGFCNLCTHAIERLINESENRYQNFDKIIEYLKTIKKKYQCIIGVSGGADSSYVAYLLKKNNINPLAIHLDNGWNSELATKNIEVILNKLEIDLKTYVINWKEFKEIQLAFLRSSISNIEIPTDHAILATLFNLASKYNLPVIHGGNLSTESIMPSTWMHDNKDLSIIKNIVKNFSKTKLKTFPQLSITKFLYYIFIKRIKYIGILNYFPYNKNEALSKLQNLGWKPYEQKHFESIFTKFFQGFILPNKFNIDKRKAHLSSLIISKQISRENAEKELKKNSFYNSTDIENDKVYFCKKLDISLEEFNKIINKPPVSSDKYSNFNKYYNFFKKQIAFIKKYATAREKY